jgi:hypothetical protein
LLLLLLLAVATLLVLLPASPLALHWVWGQLQDSAGQQGFTLHARAVRGNLWTGLALQDVELQHDAADVEVASLAVGYSLAGLLQGRLPLDISLSGVRGGVQVQDLLTQFRSAPAASGPGLPFAISIGSLDVNDVQLAFSNAPDEYVLPDLAFNGFTAGSTAGGFSFDTIVSTAEGDATVHGNYSLDQAQLLLDIPQADVAIARFWWDGIMAGSATGSVLIDAAGVTADAVIHDAAIHFLDASVTGINGSGQLRDLQIHAQVQGALLGDILDASAHVDLDAQHFSAEAQGNPQLASVVPWLGSLLNFDTDAISSAGQLQTQATVSGWKDVTVNGSARGAGQLAERPLENLEGTYAFSTQQGFSHNLDAARSGGHVTADVQPLGYHSAESGLADTNSSRLTVLARDITVADGSALQLSAQGGLTFGATAGPQRNLLAARLHGPAAGREIDLELEATPASDDLLDWHASVRGSAGLGSSLTGLLKLEAGLVSGRLELDDRAADTQTADSQTAAGVTALLRLLPTPFGSSLPLQLQASWGPVELLPLQLQLDLANSAGNLDLSDTAGQLDLLLPEDGGAQLSLAGLPLQLAGEQVSLTGSLQLPAGGQLQLDLLAEAFGLAARAWNGTAADGTQQLQAELTGASDVLSVSWDPATGIWQASGSVSAGALAQHWDLPLAGSITGTAGNAPQGRAGAASGSFSGQVSGGGVTADVQVTLDGSRLVAQAVTELLGETWQVAADLLPEPSVTATSSWGELHYTAGAPGGSGTIGSTASGMPGTPWELQPGPAGGLDGLQLLLGGALQLSASASSDDSGALSVHAAAPGLEASWVDGFVEVTASDFNLAALLPADLTGGLTHLPVSGHITGPVDELQLQLESLQDALTLQASGTLTGGSQLDVRFDGSALDGLATLAGQMRGSLLQPRLQASLALQELESGQFSLPAFHAELLLADGLLELHPAGAGEQDALRFANGQLSGGLSLPLKLLGIPHALELQATGAGCLLLQLEGALVSGGAQLLEDQAGMQVELSLNSAKLPETLTASLGAFLPAEPVTIRGNLQFDGSWQAHAGTGLDVPILPLSLGAQAQGRLLDYSGIVNVRSAASEERLLTASFSGSGGSFSVRSDLQSLAAGKLLAEAGIDAQLQAAGEVRYDVSSGPDGTDGAAGLAVDATLRGTALGTPLDLQVLGSGVAQLAITGLLAGEPLALQLALHGADAGAVPLLLGTWADASLEVRSLEDAGSRTLLQGELDTVSGAASGSFKVGLADAALELQQLQLQAGSITLQAAGPLLPVTQVAGAVQLAGEELAGLRLAADADGVLQAALRHENLELTASMAGELQLQLLGSLKLAELQPAVLQLAGQDPAAVLQEQLLLTSDLRWTQAAGFQGSLALDGPLATGTLPLALHAAATGRGTLDLQGGITTQHSRAARQDGLLDFSLQLPADPLRNRSLSGNVRVAASLNDLLPAYGGRALVLSGSLAVSGDLLDPELRGPLALSGLLSASGSVHLEGYGTSGNLQLAGEHFTLDSQLQLGAWDAQLAVQEQPLDSFFPWLPGARLESSAEAQGAIGQRTQAVVSELRITAANSLLEASGTLGSDVQGIVNLDLDLADASAGLPLEGRLRGTLTYGSTGLQRLLAGVVRGSLQLEDVVLYDGIPAMNGSAELLGSARDPEVRVNLAAGNGGQLQLVSRPARSAFELSSDVAVAGLATDFVVTGDSAGLAATGGLSLPGGAFRFVRPAGPGIELAGSGAFEHWSAQLDTDVRRLQLRAFLQTALPSLHGQLELDAGLEGGSVYLRGQLYDLQAAGLEVGDVTLNAPNLLDGWLAISGEQLNGRARLTDLAWELGRLELRLLDSLSVVASGAGHGVNAAVDLVLTGTLAGESLNIPARISGTPAELTVTSQGSVRDGAIEVDVRLADDVWQGEVRASSLQLAGVTLNASGQLAGSRLSPQLLLQTNGSLNELAADGKLLVALNDLALSELSLQQSISGAPLQEPLLLSGSIWPDLQLELSGTDSGALTVQSSQAAGNTEFTSWPLMTAGELLLPFELLLLHLDAHGGAGVKLQLEVPALPGLEAAGSLDLSSLKALMMQLERGVTMQGRNLTHGEAQLDLLQGELTLADFGIQLGSAGMQATGSINLRGQGRLDGLLRSHDEAVSALIGAPEVPFSLTADGNEVRFRSLSQLGDVAATLQLATGSADVTAALQGAGGSAGVNLQFVPGSGPQGRVTLAGLELFPGEHARAALLDGTIDLTHERAEADLHLALGAGAMKLQGNWGLADLLPGWLAPLGTAGGSFNALVNALQLESIPLLHETAAHLTGTLTTDLTVTSGSISGSIAIPDLAAAGSSLPLAARFGGSPAQAGLNGSLGSSPLELTLAGGRLEGLLDLRSFPLHLLAQALAGPLDVTAEVTGVTRFSMPLARPAESELRVATELIRLERNGVITTGNLGLDLSNGLLEISDAVFEGAGRWEASGVLRSDELDFELLATDADFSPLLGLVPPLALLDTSAAGSLRITADGTLAQPRISIESDALDFELAGISYQLNDLSVLLANQDLTAAGHLLATDPLAASLQLGGGSKLSLAPLEFSDAAFTFSGSALVPVVGPLQQLEGSIRSDGSGPGAPLLLDVTGTAGPPFRVTGSLLPLDLRLTGNDLLLSMPALYLVDTQLDVDLRLVHSDATRVSGSIFVDQARIQLQQDEPAASAATPSERSALGLGTGLLFDGITVGAPQRIRFNESFGTAELAAQLSLRGSLASPLLDGYVQALRGMLQFSGRDFEVRNAVAHFDANSGLHPLLDFTAVTSFEKNRTLPVGSSYEFVAPRDRNRIEVQLSFQGDLEAAPDTDTGFRLSVEPLLSSDARVQETRADGLTSGPRELTENELLSLITLGRVEFGSANSGAGGLAAAVAEGALGTALDMFVLSELQRALGEALGLDVVEIRSSAVSSLLSGDNGDAFSVSLRLGGYLSEEVFASYRIGAFDDPRGLYALTNEVLLTYELGPLELDLAGRVNFTDAPGLDPGTELSVGLRYAFSDFASLETGIDLSNERQQLRFGVTLRW